MIRTEEWTDLEGDRFDVRFEQHFVSLDPNPNKPDALPIHLTEHGGNMLITDKREGEEFPYENLIVRIVRIKKGRVRLTIQPRENCQKCLTPDEETRYDCGRKSSRCPREDGAL